MSVAWDVDCFSNLGDKKVQRADQDPDGFVNSEEEAGVEGRWMLQ